MGQLVLYVGLVLTNKPKRFHCVKYQSIVCPDGIIVSMLRHDVGILRDSLIHKQLQAKVRFTDENKFVLYGDPAYYIQSENYYCDRTQEPIYALY